MRTVQAKNPRQSTIITARAWMDCDLVFLDTETTGLTVSDQVVQIGVVDKVGRVLLDTLVRPTIPIPAQATAIHGITNDTVVAAPPWYIVAASLRDVTCDRPIVIYHAIYDLRMLAQTAMAQHVPGKPVAATPPTRGLCAMELYASYRAEWDNRYKCYRRHKLGEALAQCHITPPHLHNAVGDAQACRLLVTHMAAQDDEE